MRLGILIVAATVLWFAGWDRFLPHRPGLSAEKIFLGDKHKNRGIDCSSCHKENPPTQKVPTAACLGCHGDYSKVAAKTEQLQPNPHDSHLGEVPCEKCHRGHKASVNACNECHQMDMNVP
jgi:hypothetical protein